MVSKTKGRATIGFTTFGSPAILIKTRNFPPPPFGEFGLSKETFGLFLSIAKSSVLSTNPNRSLQPGNYYLVCAKGFSRANLSCLCSYIVLGCTDCQKCRFSRTLAYGKGHQSPNPWTHLRINEHPKCLYWDGLFSVR
jgi:hypothetical protein